jgi:hypothetical protein
MNECSNYCNVEFKIGNIHRNIISIILVLKHSMSNIYYNNENSFKYDIYANDYRNNSKNYRKNEE